MRILALDSLPRALRNKLLCRELAVRPQFERTVRRILESIRKGGDAALLKAARKYDCRTLRNITVSREEFSAAGSLGAEIQNAIKIAIRNVSDFHTATKIAPIQMRVNGATFGISPVPFRRAGIYVPGGKARYPTTLIMGVCAAKAAGVGEVYVCTPPNKEGAVDAPVLFAARECGVNAIFKCGGAQAIAAMAYGTKTVPKVDVIAGPGNMFVTVAKKLVRNETVIDSLAGPTELLTIADASADLKYIALDIVAQMEHSEDCFAVALLSERRLAEELKANVLKSAAESPRRRILKDSIGKNVYFLVCVNIDDATAFANDFAPEHLQICTQNAHYVLQNVRNAGTVFVGNLSAPAFGDYCAGPNHILPTLGQARVRGSLTANTFLKEITYQIYSAEAVRNLLPHASALARCEGLDAHRKSMEARLEKAT